jgi:hypothetical protein
MGGGRLAGLAGAERSLLKRALLDLFCSTIEWDIMVVFRRASILVMEYSQRIMAVFLVVLALVFQPKDRIYWFLGFMGGATSGIVLF